MLTQPTPRQHQVLAFIRDYYATEHTAPTVQEIANGFGFRSPNGAAGHLRALESKGYIRLRRGRSRNIELIHGYGLPIIGRVAAGTPVEAIENTEKVIQVPGAMFRLKPDYLLRVQGDSMIEAGIHDNDLIAVKRQTTAEPGQVVVARYDDEVTVKELRIDNGDVVLVPANSAYQPIRIPGEMVTIEGVYVGLLRDAS